MHRSESTRCATSYREQTQQREPKLLDHLIGAGEDRRRDAKVERLGRLEIDHKVQPCRLFYGQVARLCAFQDFGHV